MGIGSGDYANLPLGVPRPGQVIAGKFEVERVIAVGGMGVVLAAKHIALGQKVALKFLTSVGNAEASARFLREARAAVALRGEHVVRVIDVGTLENECPFMVMEYLEGRDLHAEIEERGCLPVTEAVGYALQACEALAEAHAIGIIHRDIKPSNLFKATRPDGSAIIKVVDFGISKRVQGETLAAGKLTSTRSLLGSPQYMAPEQLRSARSVDERADVWALGVTLHELVTGGMPFEGETVAAISAAIAADEPIRARQQNRMVPEELENILLNCLRKDPADRYRSIAALARALMPLATSDAHAHVERALEISRRSHPEADALACAETDVAGLAHVPIKLPRNEGVDRGAETLGAISTSGGQRRSRVRGIQVAAAIIVASLIVVLTIGLLKRGARVEKEPAIASGPTAAPYPAQSMTPLLQAPSPIVPLTQESASAMPQEPGVSASTTRRSTKPSPPASDGRAHAKSIASEQSTTSAKQPDSPTPVAPPHVPRPKSDPLVDRK